MSVFLSLGASIKFRPNNLFIFKKFVVDGEDPFVVPVCVILFCGIILNVAEINFCRLLSLFFLTAESDCPVFASCRG